MPRAEKRQWSGGISPSPVQWCKRTASDYQAAAAGGGGGAQLTAMRK